RYRCPCACRGRARLPRRRAVARYPLWRRRRGALGPGPRGPGDAADAELSGSTSPHEHCRPAAVAGIRVPADPGRSPIMTYCCGTPVRAGLVMFADTRTNAGVDNIPTSRKLHVFVQPGTRIMAIATAGNLSISQSVVSMLREGLENPETGETETLMNAPT